MVIRAARAGTIAAMTTGMYTTVDAGCTIGPMTCYKEPVNRAFGPNSGLFSGALTQQYCAVRNSQQTLSNLSCREGETN